MKFSLSWLKNYLDTTASVNEIADTLTAIGLEVEEIEDKATTLKGFIVAEIKTVESGHFLYYNFTSWNEILCK